MKQVSLFTMAMAGFVLLSAPLRAEKVVPNAPNMQPMPLREAQAHCAKEVPEFCAEPKNAKRCADQAITADCERAMTDENPLQHERREANWQLNQRDSR